MTVDNRKIIILIDEQNGSCPAPALPSADTNMDSFPSWRCSGNFEDIGVRKGSDLLSDPEQLLSRDNNDQPDNMDS